MPRFEVQVVVTYIDTVTVEAKNASAAASMVMVPGFSVDDAEAWDNDDDPDVTGVLGVQECVNS